MSHPLNPRQPPMSPRTLQGLRPDAGVPSVRLQDGIYRADQQRRGDRDIVRANVRIGQPFAVLGMALVKSLAADSKFKNVTGQIIYDAVTMEETRLYVRTGGLGSSQFTVVTAMIDNLLITGGSLDNGGNGSLGMRMVFADFNTDTLTWNTQPDITDATQVDPTPRTLLSGLISDRATLSGSVQGTGPLSSQSVVYSFFDSRITGILFRFTPNASLCRAVVNLISNIGFYAVTEVN